MNNRILLSIIIVNYNGRNLLQSCIESIDAQPCSHSEVIVVDNGSRDGSVEYLKVHFPYVMVIPLSRNTGFSAGNNEGLRHATGDYIMLLNNDVVVDKDCISNLIEAMDADRTVGICAAKMIVDGTNLIDSAGDGFSSNLKGFNRFDGKPSSFSEEPEFVFGACAGAAMYRRKMIEEIGFLDEDFFLIYEDTDLNFRAQLAGWKVRYVPTSVAYHKVRSTIGHMSDAALFYSIRNSELVRIKNVPFGILARCFPAYALAMFLEIIFFGIVHRKFKLYCEAKLDAFKLLPKMLKKRSEILSKKKVSNAYLYGLITPIFDMEFFSSKMKKFFKP